MSDDDTPKMVWKLKKQAPTEPERCDACHEDQPEGCYAALRIGWSYAEVCRDCLLALAAGGAGVLGWGLTERG